MLSKTPIAIAWMPGVLACACVLVFLAGSAAAQTDTGDDEESALAKATQNPVGDLISLPFQNNTLFDIGDHDRSANTLNIQPVIPVKAGRWNLINRTIVPVQYQPDMQAETGGTSGLGDINHTLFVSPAVPGAVIWGVGPSVTLPTSTDTVLGSGKLSLGPSFVALTMRGPWVVGGLVNNIWSVAGDSDRSDVNFFLFQYFVNYNLNDGWYLTSAPIITSNWEADRGERWRVPFGGGGGKIFRIGSQPMNFQSQAFYYAVTPDTNPAPAWELRVQLQFLFPQ